MSLWIDRAFLFIPIEDTASANSVATQVGPGGEAEANTFGSVLLSPTGSLPATHTACSTLCKQNFIDQLPALQAAHPTWQYYLESQGWAFDRACEYLGLTRVSTDSPL